MKYLFNLSILFIFLCANDFLAATQNTKSIPVIVELFTSEGCATCPPADKYLQALIEKQPVSGVEVIGLSEHVDYWNQLGWIDPFSSAQFSNRQKYYASFFKNAEIYTPQMIVDGTREIINGDGNKLLNDSAKSPKGNVELKIAKENGNVISLEVKVTNLPKIVDSEKRVILLAVTENNLTSKISGGENNGQKLKHAAVTRYLKNIGEAADEQNNFSVDIELDRQWKRSDLSLIAFVQETGSRRILGATLISLND